MSRPKAAAVVLRIRELLIRQRTQAINALRGHLGAFGRVVPQGAANAARLVAIVEDPDSGLPADAIATLKVLVAALAHLEAEIGKLDAEIFRRAKANEIGTTSHRASQCRTDLLRVSTTECGTSF